MSTHTGEKQNGKRKAENYLTKSDDSDSSSESGGSPETANNPDTEGSTGVKSRRIASLGWRRSNPTADGTSVPGANAASAVAASGASAPAAPTGLPGPSHLRLDSGFHPGESSRAAAAFQAGGGSSIPRPAGTDSSLSNAARARASSSRTATTAPTAQTPFSNPGSGFSVMGLLDQIESGQVNNGLSRLPALGAQQTPNVESRDPQTRERLYVAPNSSMIAPDYSQLHHSSFPSAQMGPRSSSSWGANRASSSAAVQSQPQTATDLATVRSGAQVQGEARATALGEATGTPPSKGNPAAEAASAASSRPLAAIPSEPASDSTSEPASGSEARPIAPMRARRVATKPAESVVPTSAAATGLTTERIPIPHQGEFTDEHARAGNVWLEAGSSRSRVPATASSSRPAGSSASLDELPKGPSGMLSPPRTPPKAGQLPKQPGSLPPAPKKGYQPPAPPAPLRSFAEANPQLFAQRTGQSVERVLQKIADGVLGSEAHAAAAGYPPVVPATNPPVSMAVAAPVATSTAAPSVLPPFTFTVPAAQAQVQPPVALPAPVPQHQQPLVAPQPTPVTAPVQGLPSSVVLPVQQSVAQSQPAVYMQPAPQTAIVAPAPALPPVQMIAPVSLFFPTQPVVVLPPVATVAPPVVIPQPPVFVPVQQVAVHLPPTAAPAHVAQVAPMQPEDDFMSEAPPMARQTPDVEYEMPDAPWDQEEQMIDAPPALPACQHRHVLLTQKHKMFLQKHFEYRRGKGDKEKRMTFNLSACRGNLNRFPHKVLTIDRRGGVFLTGRKNLVKGF
ncbi:hypothetical protein TWF694_003039 [Orbilia ellipsospora]|uniref:Uncharacterized protein n=1 Tax=Orbilia ellipsospora TaxID=2528407 RepID=A0AAV9X2T3_9PEZI